MEKYAVSLADEISAAFDAEIEIVPEYGGEGNLDVFADNLVVFSSRESGRYPEDGEIVKILKS